MKSKWIFILNLLLFIHFIQAQQPQTLVLDQIYDVQLIPNIPKFFKIIIDKPVGNQTQLYITAQSPFNDPYELPQMTITSEKQYKQFCFDAAAQFSDLCSIPTKQLTQKRQFKLEVKCAVNCSLEISAYLSDVLKLDLGQAIIVSAMDNFGIAVDLQIQIPQNITFTQIYIEANIVNLNEVNEGLKLNVNYGKYNQTKIPTILDYTIKGQATWKDGLGISLTKQVVKPGQWIKIFLYVSQKMKVKFTTQIIQGNEYKLELNQQRYDLITYQEGRTYVLNLTNFMEEIKDENIDIFISIYSGDPDVIISFDKSFPEGKLITNDYISGNINCMLTPQIRKQFNFTGMIYIKVQSFWSASYKIYGWLNKKDFVPMALEVTQITQVFKGQVQNYLYQEKFFKPNNNQNQSTILNYVIKIQMMQGSALFGIRRCKSFQTNFSLNCLIKKPQQFEIKQNIQSFDEIEGSVVKSYTIYEIRFKYDFSKCPATAQNNGTTYYCVLQLAGTYDASEFNSTTYAATIYKREISISLKEGQIVKDTVDKGSYHFYVFRLPSQKNITQVSFFLTTIQGDSLILGSVDYQYPTLFDLGSKNITFSNDNVLIFGNLTDNTFYISVYGYQSSDYTLTTVVKRVNKDPKQKSNQNGLTSINLKQNSIQQYTISQNHQSLLFSLNLTPQKPVKVVVTALQGVVTYSVRKIQLQNNRKVTLPVTCEKSGDTCQFTTTKDFDEYQVLVLGNISQTQIFTIGYSYPQLSRCSQHLMNTPILLTIDKNNKQCLSYTLQSAKQLQILISVTSLQLIDGRIIANIRIGNKTLQIQQHSKKITIDQIQIACNGKQKFKPCQLILQFNSTQQNAAFFVVIQESGNEMILFDGIPQKVNTLMNNQQIGLHYHYQVYYPNRSVKIYFTTQSSQKYIIIAKLMNQQDYLKSSVSVFPTISSKQVSNQIFRRQTTGQMTIMKIGHEQIQKSLCNDCMLAISVFKKQGTELNKYKYKIQITQFGTHINVGQSKIGYVESGQIYEYTVSTKGLSGGLFSVSSIHNDNCAGILIDNLNQSISTYKTSVSLNEKDKKYKIYVKGYKQCSYQVSFSNSDKPIHQTILSVPQSISLNNSTIQYLIYYHETNQTFQLVQNIISGDSKIYLRPIGQNEQLSKILQQKLETFPFSDQDGSFSDIRVNNNDKKFCFKCYYIIGIQGIPNVKEDIMILLESKLIPLKQNSILKDKLLKGSKTNKKYVYHSINAFNLTVGVLYGKVNLTVQSPSGSMIINSQVITTKTFTIKHPKQAQNNFIDLFDDSSKFTIILTSDQDSGYYLQITKHNITLRVKEGLPVLLQINNQTTTSLQYINYNQGKTISIIVQGLTTQLLTPNSIQFNIELEKQDNNEGINNEIKKVVNSILQSQNSYNIELNSYQSTYIISLKSNRIERLNISLIIARNQLTHLISSHNNLFTHEGIFEIYHANKSLMVEIFNCKGEVQVSASSNYTFLEDNQDHFGQINMERANYGGHYVISAQGQQGQYFLKTINKNKNKKHEQLLYLITYFFYDKGQIMPYKKITTQNDKITPSIADKARLFTLKPIFVKQSYNLDIKSIQYQLLISSQQNFIKQYSQCMMSSVHVQKFTVNENFDSESAIPIFKIENQMLPHFIGTTAKQFYVGAIAIIQLNTTFLSPNYPKQLTYIYDYTQVTIGAQIIETQKQSKTYFIWIVLPFLLASLFLMLACRYCIRRVYSTYYPTAFIQEQGFEPSDESFQPQAKN